METKTDRPPGTRPRDGRAMRIIVLSLIGLLVLVALIYFGIVRAFHHAQASAIASAPAGYATPPKTGTRTVNTGVATGGAGASHNSVADGNSTGGTMPGGGAASMSQSPAPERATPSLSAPIQPPVPPAVTQSDKPTPSIIHPETATPGGQNR